MSKAKVVRTAKAPSNVKLPRIKDGRGWVSGVTKKALETRLATIRKTATGRVTGVLVAKQLGISRVGLYAMARRLGVELSFRKGGQ